MSGDYGSANVWSWACHERRLIGRYMNCPMPTAHCLLGLHAHTVWRMSWEVLHLVLFDLKHTVSQADVLFFVGKSKQQQLFLEYNLWSSHHRKSDLHVIHSSSWDIWLSKPKLNYLIIIIIFIWWWRNALPSRQLTINIYIYIFVFYCDQLHTCPAYGLPKFIYSPFTSFLCLCLI